MLFVLLVTCILSTFLRIWEPYINTATITPRTQLSFFVKPSNKKLNRLDHKVTHPNSAGRFCTDTMQPPLFLHKYNSGGTQAGLVAPQLNRHGSNTNENSYCVTAGGSPSVRKTGRRSSRQGCKRGFFEVKRLHHSSLLFELPGWRLPTRLQDFSVIIWYFQPQDVIQM
eukprot:g60623.t1